MHIDVTIGFIDSPYSVNENERQVVIQVGVIEGSLQREVVVSFSTSDSAAIGKPTCYLRNKVVIIILLLLFSDGNDYTRFVDLQLSFDSATTTFDIPVSIIDDSVYELTEYFKSALSFPGAPVPRVTLYPNSTQTAIFDDDGS